MDKKIKRLPYGISGFKELREKDRYCVDKSMYLPKLEMAGDFLFLIRPRRFGKSVFLSMMHAYYDMEAQDQFDTLFDGMWIKEHPTELRGKFQVVYLDFSQAVSGLDNMEEQFHKYCALKLISFADTYAKYYGDDFVAMVKSLYPDSHLQMVYICDEAKKRGIPLYLILDEYDNFTNDVLSEKGQAVYHALTHATGFYREVFKLYKPNFSNILMMGVSPVTLDDLTSGFNIALNISMDSWFNMMLGFSETEVRQMIEYYREAGKITADTDDIIDDMRPWYDNYCFSEESYGKDPTVFNCDMVIYYMRHLVEKGCPPKDKLDVNTKTDYKKMKRLVELDGMGEKQQSLIRRLASEGTTIGTVITSFPAERIYDKKNFVSLLYYYGMLTIGGARGSQLILKVPNNNVRKQYYEYLIEEYETTGRGMIDFSEIEEGFYDMATVGDWRPVMEKIGADYATLSSVRDAMEGERNVQGFVMCALSICPYYVTAPEVELSHGYCDFYLLPDKTRYPETAHSYIIELKYLGANAGEEAAESQWEEAIGQIRHYATDRKVAAMSQGTQLHLVIMQVRSCQLLRLEEVAGGQVRMA